MVGESGGEMHLSCDALWSSMVYSWPIIGGFIGQVIVDFRVPVARIY
jgi:hypothetical protein